MFSALQSRQSDFRELATLTQRDGTVAQLVALLPHIVASIQGPFCAEFSRRGFSPGSPASFHNPKTSEAKRQLMSIGANVNDCLSLCDPVLRKEQEYKYDTWMNFNRMSVR